MNRIKETRSTNPTERDVPRLNDPLGKPGTFTDDKALTTDAQMKYPMLKPMAFSNPIQDDYLNSGVWHLKDKRD